MGRHTGLHVLRGSGASVSTFWKNRRMRKKVTSLGNPTCHVGHGLEPGSVGGNALSLSGHLLLVSLSIVFFLFYVCRLAFSSFWFLRWFLMSAYIIVLVSAERDSLNLNSQERELVLRRWLAW